MNKHFVPKGLMLLGWLPMLASSLLLLSGVNFFVGIDLSVWRFIDLYYAVILSFMGGISWGLALALPELANNKFRVNLFLSSIVPTIVAMLIATVVSFYLRPMFFLVAYVVQYLFDDFLYKFGHLPPWYFQHRLLITTLICSCLLINLYIAYS